jgi:hypothetical protein
MLLLLLLWRLLQLGRRGLTLPPAAAAAAAAAAVQLPAAACSGKVCKQVIYKYMTWPSQVLHRVVPDDTCTASSKHQLQAGSIASDEPC